MAKKKKKAVRKVKAHKIKRPKVETPIPVVIEAVALVPEEHVLVVVPIEKTKETFWHQVLEWIKKQ
jgi:hypothetical protein